ncbi:MAG: hypothetical protein H6905_10105 [Hyphomicrobiales bacterium]|nr:hypothetical protein [Hyphomicrobiales bacterium]
MNGVRAFGLSILMVSALTACTTGDCDPSKGGLFQGISCDASGGFDQRISEREDTRTSLLQRRAELIREKDAAEAERDAVASDLAKKQAEQKQAEKKLADLNKQLAGAQEGNRALEKEAEALAADIEKTQAEITELQQAESKKQARIQQLNQEQENLNEEYKAYRGR